MRYLYTFLLYLAMPFVFLRLFWRSRRLKAYRLRMRERLGFYPFRLDKCMWVHTVSVGELIAAIPLIKALQAEYPYLMMLVTTMTPTGAERVKVAFGDSVKHVYLPYDLPFAINRFLNAMNPQFCVVMETEMWPNILNACAKRGIPVCLTNARLSEKSARGYRRIAPLTREMLKNIRQISACQDTDAERFQSLGATTQQLTVTGNLKFDLVITEEVVAKGAALRTQLGQDRFVWIAASTHEGEEEMVLAAHQALLAKYPNALLILVPRHPDRFAAVTALTKTKFTTQNRSSGGVVAADTAVYIGDTMGELLVMYAASDVAFVAGSLIPRGGHNVLEAAALAKPILTGEHIFNFKDICHMMQRSQALVMVADVNDLAKTILKLADDISYREQLGQHALHVMNQNRGALAKQLQLIRQMVAERVL